MAWEQILSREYLAAAGLMRDGSHAEVPHRPRRRGVVNGWNESQPPAWPGDSTLNPYALGKVAASPLEPADTWVQAVQASARAASAMSAEYAKSVLRDVGAIVPKDPYLLERAVLEAERVFRVATVDGEEHNMTQTIPERVSALEDRQARLEESLRSYFEDALRRADQLIGQIPEDARIAEAVESLIQEAGLIPRP
jgi:hypothetical protein